jgi:hypothetical protein
MKVGDLVKLKRWCRNSDRWAIITEAPDCLNCAKIIFLDDGSIESALKNNLEVISECR